MEEGISSGWGILLGGNWKLKLQLYAGINPQGFYAERYPENLVYFLVRADFSIPNISYFPLVVDRGLYPGKNQTQNNP